MTIFRMQAKVIFFLLFLYLLLPFASQATDITAPIFIDEVTGINDFPILRMKSGHTVVLSGIERPASHGVKEYSLSQSKLWLSDRLMGQHVVVQPSGNHYDIFGRVHAFVKKTEGDWLNHQLIQEGLARVQLTHGFTHQSDILLKLEEEARQSQNGFWGSKDFQRYNATSYDGPLEGFVIVSGVITQAAKRTSYLYLNFGKDWRDDFTIGIPIDKEYFDIRIMKETYTSGRKIEVRGLIESWNGPFIRLELPEHLRLIKD